MKTLRFAAGRPTAAPAPASASAGLTSRHTTGIGSARTLLLFLGATLTTLAALATPATADAQTGNLRVTVQTEQGDALSATTIVIDGTTTGAFTGPEGVALISGIPAGEQWVRASRPGYRIQSLSVTIVAGATADLSFTLSSTPIELGGIQVSVLRPDLRPELRIEAAQLQEANPHDIGAVLRTLPGLDAIRRGGLGLDPVVRGMRDTQVGSYVDGMRTLPGGPGGMDTPLSHVDPSAVREMEVVKGPYALTWGSGNTNAIRIETSPLPARGAGAVSGRLLLGHDTNLGATETGLEVRGAGDRIGYSVSGAWRESGDYESGGGSPTPAGFTSSELRGRVGLFAAPGSTVTISGWRQSQRNIDYPGRPLDADFFDTYNASLKWELAPAAGRLRNLDAMVYFYSVDHAMNNDQKPTSLANPNRMPPFAMDIVTTSNVGMVGGRIAGEFAPGGDWIVEIGGDGYTALHEAGSTNRNRDTGVVMMERLIWGDARVSNLGAFTRFSHPIGRVSATGTLRLDRVEADADSASTFFLENASAGLAVTETNPSGALTLTLPVTAYWSISAGAGSVVRTADANERYSDRAPSKRAQIGAEFMGDPGIRPERSTQFDLWLEASYPRWAGSLNLFAQRIDDNITIQDTDLPRQSPMSAPTVYRYVNGDARYQGVEASARVAVTDAWSLSTSTAWLRGEDVTLNEPVLGASPWRGDLAVRWEPATDGRFMEVSGRAVAGQDRVSTTRGELTTPGYGILDLQGGLPLPGGVFLRAGVNNVLDREYVNHLNARNPFTGLPVAEPGRVLFARMSVHF